MNIKLIYTIFKIITILFFAYIFVQICIFFNIISFPNLKEQQPFFGTIWAILGSTWALFGIWSLLKQEKRIDIIHPSTNNVSLIANPKSFINRVDDISILLELLTKSTNISIFGRKGVGKSELLKCIHDILIRGKILDKLSPEMKRNLKKLPINAIYIDLVDSTSWENTILQLSFLLTGEDKYKDTIQICNNISNSNLNKKQIIIIDNVNNIATAQNLIHFISKYKRYRNDDIFIIGSILRFTDPINKTFPFEVKPFNDNHCKQFIESKNITVTEKDLAAIINKSMGLPLFLNILSFYKHSIHEENETLSNYFISEFFNKLNDEKEILLFLSICNIYITTVSTDSYLISNFTNFNNKLKKLKDFSLLIITNLNNINQIKVHDLFRDIILEYQQKHIPTVSIKVSSFFKNRDKTTSLSFKLLSKNSLEIDTKEIIDDLNFLLRSNNNAFFLSCWENSIKWADSSSVFQMNKNIKIHILYGYISALLATGSYFKAEELLSSTLVYDLKPLRPDEIKTQLDFNFMYSLIDLDHLLNRYNIAKEYAYLLYMKAKSFNWHNEMGNALWLSAHLSGHIGDNLKNTLSIYDRCIDIATCYENKLLKLRSLNGKMSINFTLGNINEYTDNNIKSFIRESIEIDGNASLLSSLYKNLSRYYKLKNDYISASKNLKKSIEISHKYGLRTIINRDYDKAEILRFSESYIDAIPYYKNVLVATENNGDKNLYTSALLAICICELSSEELNYFDSMSMVETTIINIINIAEEYDMKITEVRAEIVHWFWSSKNNIDYFDLDNLINKLTQLNLNRDITLIENKDIKYLEIHTH